MMTTTVADKKLQRCLELGKIKMELKAEKMSFKQYCDEKGVSYHNTYKLARIGELEIINPGEGLKQLNKLRDRKARVQNDYYHRQRNELIKLRKLHNEQK